MYYFEEMLHELFIVFLFGHHVYYYTVHVLRGYLNYAMKPICEKINEKKTIFEEN